MQRNAHAADALVNRTVGRTLLACAFWSAVAKHRLGCLEASRFCSSSINPNIQSGVAPPHSKSAHARTLRHCPNARKLAIAAQVHSLRRTQILLLQRLLPCRKATG